MEYLHVKDNIILIFLPNEQFNNDDENLNFILTAMLHTHLSHPHIAKPWWASFKASELLCTLLIKLTRNIYTKRFIVRK